MDNQNETKRNFSVAKRKESFVNAGRGIKIYLRTTHNAWIHLAVFALVICLGFYFAITPTEWVELIFAGGIVLAAEAFNTAIEIDINLTSPDFHPYARDTKDVAAGAVLITTFVAVVIGILIFVHYFFVF